MPVHYIQNIPFARVRNQKTTYMPCAADVYTRLGNAYSDHERIFLYKMLSHAQW